MNKEDNNQNKIDVLTDNMISYLEIQKKNDKKIIKKIRLLPHLKKVYDFISKNETSIEADFFCDGFIEGADWQKKQSPWISTEERLPELNERVLVAQRGVNRISICIMKRIPHDSSNPDNKKWYWSLTNDKSEIIAWMPLPHFDETLLKRKGK